MQLLYNYRFAAKNIWFFIFRLIHYFGFSFCRKCITKMCSFMSCVYAIRVDYVSMCNVYIDSVYVQNSMIRRDMIRRGVEENVNVYILFISPSVYSISILSYYRIDSHIAITHIHIPQKIRSIYYSNIQIRWRKINYIFSSSSSSAHMIWMATHMAGNLLSFEWNSFAFNSGSKSSIWDSFILYVSLSILYSTIRHEDEYINWNHAWIFFFIIIVSIHLIYM